ncbi:hypothetical protein SS33_25500 [Enterobacter kobei]|uniref:ead/Ea22-like family protein n=1 Tax=Enterobacter kobei TaxID=208224 RepID=UPI0005EC144A|nr:ead/Ea22-like family protein [Enterobacter kobei]ELY2041142.1 ead/Ea22-like family protein [Enterobacter ludwigii]KJM83712.1 hypothetical protein SS33_25500 [Enterobacter kobei]
MNNIDKQSLRQTAEKAQEHGVFNMDIHSQTVLALLDEMEAKDKLSAELMEKQRLIDICQGQGLEHRIAAEKRAEAAEKKTVEMPTFDGYVPHVARELQAAFRIACDNAGINIAAAGKGEAS